VSDKFRIWLGAGQFTVSISSALPPFHEVSSAICSGEKRVESSTIRGQRERPETLLIRWSHTKYATAARFIMDNEIIHGREREW